MFGLVRRFICAKMLEVSRDHWLGDQAALEAWSASPTRNSKAPGTVPGASRAPWPGPTAGYRFVPKPDAVATAVLAASTWAVLGLTLPLFEFFTQATYRSNIEPDEELSPLWKDVSSPLARRVAARRPRRAGMAAGMPAWTPPRDAAVGDPDQPGRRRRRQPAGPAGSRRYRVLRQRPGAVVHRR